MADYDACGVGNAAYEDDITARCTDEAGHSGPCTWAKPSRFRYVVTVDAETQEQADQVMLERVGYDEDYGFDYSIKWDPQ